MSSLSRVQATLVPVLFAAGLGATALPAAAQPADAAVGPEGARDRGRADRLAGGWSDAGPYRAAARASAELTAAARGRAPSMPGTGPAAAAASSGAPVTTPGRPYDAAASDGPHPLVLGLAGVGASAAGMLAGFAIGPEVGCDGSGSDEFCALGGALIGAAIGTAVTTPLTVHLANGRRGSWILDQAASLGYGALALGIVAALPDDGDDVGQGIVALSIPLGQTAASVAVEKATAPGRL